MAKLIVDTPTDANKILSLVNPCGKPYERVIIRMDDSSKFIVNKWLVNLFDASKIKRIQFMTSVSETQPVYIPHYIYDAALNTLPSNLASQPMVVREINILVEYNDTNTSFPGIGIEYYQANMAITDPPDYVAYEVKPSKYIFKKNSNEVWVPLNEAAAYIFRVRALDTEAHFYDLEYGGDRPRDMDTAIPIGKFYYDPLMQTIQINVISLPEIGTNNIVVVEYSISGCKATVPIEAKNTGPMYDVDIGTITQIHPDDTSKLPSYLDASNTVAGWQVVNDEELQGGYRYWDSQWVDVVALKYNLGIPEGMNDYLGRGINFQKIGVAPDSFDADVSDYRSFFIDPSGAFPSGLWQGKARGYVTFVGPPNQVIPAGIRLVAPESIVKVDGAITDSQVIASSPRLPNGGMNPAPLILTLEPNTSNPFPPNVFARKTGAFRPRLMLYLRERVKYTGATYWKDIGEGYGESSEITGTPYWEA